MKVSNGVTTKKKKTELEANVTTSRYVTNQYAVYICVHECMSLGRKVSGELLNLPLDVLFNLRMVVCRMVFAKQFELAIGNIAVKIKLVWLLCWTCMLIIFKLL